MARVYVGTCSWSDHTDFYPPGLKSTEQISYYARYFPVVEINSTFYHMAPARNYAAWARRTPEGFLFDVKPYKQLTYHDRQNPPDLETATDFRDSMQPLRDAGKLGAVHFQFPPWFKHSERNLDYIRRLREFFAEDRIGVEFRHRSWLDKAHVSEVVGALRDAGVSLTVVDEPQLGSGSVPTVLKVTNPDLVIVRFHGRNYKKWYAKVKRTGDRFDYLYSEEELRDWAPKAEELASQAREVHLLFNNNNRNYAVQNGQQLRLILQEQIRSGEVVAPPGG